MKRLLLICLMFCSLMVQAQDLKSLFVAMPDSLSPLWTEVNRADFGDFLASNMKARVRNRFGNFSEMLKLTDDYLLMQSTSVSTMEMKLLPVNDSVNIICMVQTYQAPVADSRISFTIRHGKNFLFLSLYSFLKKVCFIRHRKQRLRLIRWQTYGSMPTCIC